MKKQLIRFSCAGLLALTMAGNALAQTADGALKMVKDSVSIVLADLKANRGEYQSNPAALNRLINQKMLPYFDAEGMARGVLARNWHKATAAQRQAFLNEFKQLLMRSYSAKLLEYTNAKVEYGKPNKVERNRTKVDATVISNGKRYPLTLSVGYRQGQWKAYDVSLDGLSLITTFRSSIGEQVSQKGLQAVIDEIKVKNRKGEVEN